MVVFISVVEAAMEIILQVVAAKKIGCSSTWLISGSLISVDGHQPTYRGLFIAIISYPVIKGGVSLTPQYIVDRPNGTFIENPKILC